VPGFYPELLNLVEEASSAAEPVSSAVLFTRYDAQALERTVGAERGGRLLADGPRSTFFFV
jgi:hypothetical protein